MRNPLDKKLNPTDPMVVKEGQLTASSEAMDPQTLALVNQLQVMLGNKRVGDANSPPAVAALAAQAEPDLGGGPSVLGRITPKRSTWPMTIIRGPKVEEVEIKLTAKESEEVQPVGESTAGE
jgi:hypothetical protein